MVGTMLWIYLMMIRLSIYTVFKRYRLDWLQKCIDALNNQTCKDFEYIFLVYGKDNDVIGISNVLKTLTIPYKAYYEPDTESFIPALKLAVDKCGADLILRADAEDFLFPFAVERMLEFTEHQMIIPNYIPIDNDSNIIGNGVRGAVEDISSNCIMHKALFNKIKFNQYQVCRDGYAIIRGMKELGIKPYYLDESMFYYRKHPGSITNNVRTNDIKKWNEMLVDNMYKYNLNTTELLIDKNDKFIITSERIIER